MEPIRNSPWIWLLNAQLALMEILDFKSLFHKWLHYIPELSVSRRFRYAIGHASFGCPAREEKRGKPNAPIHRLSTLPFT
jgi:hypothetical protein